jgi:acyl-coenzyme A synthetase/AMP-(fatty) acid ligase
MIRRSISGFFSEDRAETDLVAFDGEGVIDIAQFYRDVAWNASRLRDLSCQQGLLACRDTYWAAVGLLSLLQAGAHVALSSSQPRDSGMISDRSGDVVVTDRPWDDVAGPDDKTALILAAGEGRQSPLSALNPDRSVIGLFTSGSTGQPKRIEKTLRQLECEAQTIEAFFGPRLPAMTPVHATVPHHHLYGLTFGLIWPLLAGRPFNRHMHAIWETVFGSDIHGAVLVASPAHLTRLAGFEKLEKRQKPSLILSAGAPLPASAAAEACALFSCAPTEIFGSTETGAIASRSWTAGGAPWSPLPGVTVDRLPDGRMSVSSPFLPDDQPFIGADLIEMQADGCFIALGRADDICKIEGKRISLSSVETQLLQLSGVAEAAVIVLEEARPRLGAVVKLDAAGAEELAKQGIFRFGQTLRRHLAEKLETASLPKRWRFVDTLPLRALGKRRIADLQALFAEETIAVLTQAKDEPEIRATRLSTDLAAPPRIELDLFIAPDLPQLDGHFPDLPIVPGVALVDWAVRFAGRYLQIGDGVARALQVKFRRITAPDNLVTLILEHQPDRHRLAFTYRQGEQILASGNFQVLP